MTKLQLPESVLELCHLGVYTLYDIEPIGTAVYLLATPHASCCSGRGHEDRPDAYLLDETGKDVLSIKGKFFEDYKLLRLSELPPAPQSFLDRCIHIDNSWPRSGRR